MKKKAFRAAFPYTLPICIGFLFLGMSYGFMMRSKGFSFVYPLLISFWTAEFVICQPAEGQRPEQLISHPKAPVNAGAFSFTSEETVIHSRY